MLGWILKSTQPKNSFFSRDRLVADINTTITTIAVNVAQRLFYWSDSSNSTIYRATFDGGNVTALVGEKHGKKFCSNPSTEMAVILTIEMI